MKNGLANIDAQLSAYFTGSRDMDFKVIEGVYESNRARETRNRELDKFL